jgi:hypothetical protein
LKLSFHKNGGPSFPTSPLNAGGCKYPKNLDSLFEAAMLLAMAEGNCKGEAKSPK